MFDENAIDHTDKVKKGQNCWNPIPTINVKQESFAVYKDGNFCKTQRHALAPISQSLEDSVCSFTSMNTSLHQLEYVLQHKEEASCEAFKLQVSCL